MKRLITLALIIAAFFPSASAQQMSEEYCQAAFKNLISQPTRGSFGIANFASTFVDMVRESTPAKQLLRCPQLSGQAWYMILTIAEQGPSYQGDETAAILTIVFSEPQDAGKVENVRKLVCLRLWEKGWYGGFMFWNSILVHTLLGYNKDLARDNMHQYTKEEMEAAAGKYCPDELKPL